MLFLNIYHSAAVTVTYHIRYGAELRRNTACIQQHTARLEAKYVTKIGRTLVI